MILKEEGLRYAKFDALRKAARVSSHKRSTTRHHRSTSLGQAFETSDNPQLVQIALETIIAQTSDSDGSAKRPILPERG